MSKAYDKSCARLDRAHEARQRASAAWRNTPFGSHAEAKAEEKWDAATQRYHKLRSIHVLKFNR